MNLVIETTGLTRVFGNVRAVDGLDLRVESGKFFGFLGPNGAGKSTTIKMLTGLGPGGRASSARTAETIEREVRRRIGVVPGTSRSTPPAANISLSLGMYLLRPRWSARVPMVLLMMGLHDGKAHT
jgi:ABC-2 type transport system ATP-binding protein